MRERAVVIASCIVAAVLIVATGIAVSSIYVARTSFASVERTRTTLTAFTTAQAAVAAEAYGEAGYRRAPSVTSRTALELSLTRVTPALRAIRSVGTRRDAAVADQLEILNARYVAQLRTVLAGPVTYLPTTPDDRVAGPALDAMDELVDAAIAGHRAEVTAARARQEELLDRSEVVVPVAMVSAVLIIGCCWRVILRQHRRIHTFAAEQQWGAEHDSLTGLPNRVPLWRHLEALLAADRPDCALLLLDLDQFKAINDTWGHNAGDEVLRTVADRVSGILGPHEVCARLGGDELAVVTQPATAAVELAERIRLAVEQPLDLGPAMIIPRVSVGRAEARPGHDRVEMVRIADAALYSEKASHRTVPVVPHPRPESAPVDNLR